MERFLRIGVVLLIVTLACFMSAGIVNDGFTATLVVQAVTILCLVGVGFGARKIYRHEQSEAVASGAAVATVGSFVLLIIVFSFAGEQLGQALQSTFSDSSAGWMLGPLVGTAGITVFLGLHQRR